MAKQNTLWTTLQLVYLMILLSAFSPVEMTSDGLIDCSATRQDGGQPFRMGDFILLSCAWVELTEPMSLVNNVTTTPAPGVTENAAPTTPQMRARRPQLAWFRRGVAGNISELSAAHERVVKWRLAADDNGIEFFCAPVNGSKILSAPTCSQRPLVVPPDVSIISSPGTHVIGEGNTFTCDATAMPGVKTYEWFINGEQLYPDHDPRFSGNHHVIVDDENDHKHRHLTFDKLNATDNYTRITCRAWTTTGISNNASILLMLTEKCQNNASFFGDSVVLLACLAAGGAPVVFLICVCIVWGIRRSRMKKRVAEYNINYSGSFKSDEDASPASPERHASLQRHSEANNTHSAGNHHGRGTTASVTQRPNFFKQKLNRFSQMFFGPTPTRYADEEESIYENTNPPLTTTFSNDNGTLRGGEISRGGSLQLPHHRTTLSKSMSTPAASAMSAPLTLTRTTSHHAAETEYENFMPPPLEEFENQPSILDNPPSPTW